MSFRNSICVLACVAVCVSSKVSEAQQTTARVSPESARLAAEVSVAINPTNLDNFVAGSLLRGYPDSNEPNGSFFTFDGGVTWETVMVPNPDSRTQGDDVVLFRRDGTCVHAFISFKGLWESFPEQCATGILLCHSKDGGRTWGDQVVVANHINTRSPMEDKPWLVFDNNRRSPHFNHLYCSWTRFDQYGSDDPQDTSQIMFARSRDGGESFDPVSRISDQGGDCLDDDGTLEGAVPCVDVDGNVYVVWAGPRGLEIDQSIDGGKTFGEDKIIMETPGGWSSDVEGIGRHNGMPVTAVDHSQGEYRDSIYVNWIDERNQDKDVFLMVSRDKGQTWSKAIRVNDDDSDRDQFFTWMAVDPVDGSVNIAFYDRRDTLGTGTRLTLCRSVDGGQTFTNIPFDCPEFETQEGIFFGDYIGIDARRGRVVVAYMDFAKPSKLEIACSVFDFEPGSVRLLDEAERGNGSQPDFVTVQHILIGFKGSVGDKVIDRTQEEAEQLANEILKKARSGGDFDALVKTHTDDEHPGIYTMANFFSPSNMSPDDGDQATFPRAGMVGAFGNTGFPLEVGEIGLANYDPETSKYGWHVIKRIK